MTVWFVYITFLKMHSLNAYPLWFERDVYNTITVLLKVLQWMLGFDTMLDKYTGKLPTSSNTYFNISM